jgi:hypothetical protein
MNNFFKELNNRVKPLVKGSDLFFLRIITEKETLLSNPKIIDLLNRLMFESEQDLKKNIARKGEKLKEEHKQNEMWQVSDAWLDDNFVKQDNRMMFVVENKKQEPLSVAITWIDDKEIRQLLQVPESVGTFFYVPFTITEEAYKNTGIASLMFDKVITMLQREDRKTPQPIVFNTSVNIAKSIKENGEEFAHVMNLPRYFTMWSQRFTNNQIQVKHRDLKTFIQEGKDLIDFKDISNQDGTYNAEKVNNIIENEKPNLKDGWENRGFFVRGEENRTYAESKEVRKQRATKFIERFEQKAKL